MSSFEISTQALRNAATNTGIICQAIAHHPVHRMIAGDFGHTGIAAALSEFQRSWAAEFALRKNASEDAGRLLSHAAADAERVDVLLAQAALRLGTHR